MSPDWPALRQTIAGTSKFDTKLHGARHSVLRRRFRYAARGPPCRTYAVLCSNDQAEIDGGYFGGYSQPANLKKYRRDRRLAENQTGKRQVVVVARARGGKAIAVPRVFNAESDAVGWISRRVAKGTHLMVDEAKSWNPLHSRFPMSRIDHGQVYSTDNGIYTNLAESFLARLRRAEIGIHHHIAVPYFGYYADANAWRENNRRTDNGTQIQTVMRVAMAAPVSVDWCDYWQRSAR